LPEPLTVIALFGPTGLGKTAIAIELAQILRDRGEDPVAVSVDSMQVYRELPILTGAAIFSATRALKFLLVWWIGNRGNHENTLVVRASVIKRCAASN